MFAKETSVLVGGRPIVDSSSRVPFWVCDIFSLFDHTIPVGSFHLDALLLTPQGLCLLWRIWGSRTYPFDCVDENMFAKETSVLVGAGQDAIPEIAYYFECAIYFFCSTGLYQIPAVAYYFEGATYFRCSTGLFQIPTTANHFECVTYFRCSTG